MLFLNASLITVRILVDLCHTTDFQQHRGSICTIKGFCNANIRFPGCKFANALTSPCGSFIEAGLCNQHKMVQTALNTGVSGGLLAQMDG